MKHSIKKTITVTFLFCAIACAVFAQTSGRATPSDATIVAGDLGTRLDQYLTRLAAYGFSGAVLVSKGDGILLRKGYGLADAQHENSTQTVYDVASLAKQFTAAAILKLETQGKLKTSDPLGKHFANVPNDKRAITKTSRGGRLNSHDGVTFDGFNSIFQRYVDDGFVVIAASNSFAGRYLPMDLIAPVINSFLFDGGAPPPPAFIALGAGAMEKYRGVYRLGSGARLIVNVGEDKLLIGAEGQEAVDLLAAVDAAGGRTLAAFNERTAALLDGARTGNYETAIRVNIGGLIYGHTAG
jgi:hypothetical protein